MEWFCKLLPLPPSSATATGNICEWRQFFDIYDFCVSRELAAERSWSLRGRMSINYRSWANFEDHKPGSTLGWSFFLKFRLLHYMHLAVSYEKFKDQKKWKSRDSPKTLNLWFWLLTDVSERSSNMHFKQRSRRRWQVDQLAPVGMEMFAPSLLTIRAPIYYSIYSSC